MPKCIQVANPHTMTIIANHLPNWSRLDFFLIILSHHTINLTSAQFLLQGYIDITHTDIYTHTDTYTHTVAILQQNYLLYSHIYLYTCLLCKQLSFSYNCYYIMNHNNRDDKEVGVANKVKSPEKQPKFS